MSKPLIDLHFRRTSCCHTHTKLLVCIGEGYGALAQDGLRMLSIKVFVSFISFFYLEIAESNMNSLLDLGDQFFFSFKKMS